MEQIKLDIVPVGVAPVAHASQFDNGRQIRFNLFNQGTPYTLTGAETVTMVVNGEEENITNTSDNYVIWDVAEEDCEEAGVIGCEIRIVLGSMLIGSKNFFLEVEMDPYDGKNIRIVTVGPADICTFETTLPEPLQSVIVDIEATGGNGTPVSPIPINGYTEANITRCGVNFLPLKFYKGLEYNSAIGNTFDTEEATDGTVSGNTVSFNIGSWGRKCMLSTKLPSGIEYRLTMAVTSSASILNYTEFYLDKDLKVTRKYNIQNSGTSRIVNAGFTLNDNEAYIAIELGCSSSATIVFDSPMLNVGSTAIAYTPYNGQTYTIAFGQTVYGGVLDVTRGKLHVTWSNAVDLGSLGWSYDVAQQVFVTTNFVGYKNGTPFLCDVYTDLGAVAISQITNYGGTLRGAALYIKNTDYTDAPTFKTAMSGKYITAELATPFDIDLTPEVISAVVGTNNVFADCGQTTVKYLKAE